MFKVLQKVGKAFMLPIAILPAAGLLLGIGGALSNPETVKSYPFLDQVVLQNIFKLMTAAGVVAFENLALLLTLGLAIGLAKRDKGTAALSALISYLIMSKTITTLLAIFGGENARPIDTGVIGSLVLGGVVVYLHNKYHNIELPQFLGFFGGSRFVPIVSSFAAIFVGVLFYEIWPTFQTGLLLLGEKIANLGYLGTFLYGFILRLSGAVGLHHMIYPLFWYTELGGVETIAGETIVGAQKIFFAQLSDSNHIGLFTEGTKYFAGRFATMMFGLPGAAFAMFHCIPKSNPNRKKYAGLLLGVAFTSFLTGITEPLEYMFLFVAPFLYVVHSFFDGLSFLVADLLKIRIGNTFSGGLIDYTLFGILQGQAKTHFMYVLLQGMAWFALYYFTFRFLITKFNIMTPGRGNEEQEEEQEETKNVDLHTTSLKIIELLGGEQNLEDVDACITRLRVAVKDNSLVNKEGLKKLGAIDVLEVKGGVQAIFGAKAVIYKNEILKILNITD